MLTFRTAKFVNGIFMAVGLALFAADLFAWWHLRGAHTFLEASSRGAHLSLASWLLGLWGFAYMLWNRRNHTRKTGKR